MPSEFETKTNDTVELPDIKKIKPANVVKGNKGVIESPVLSNLQKRVTIEKEDKEEPKPKHFESLSEVACFLGRSIVTENGKTEALFSINKDGIAQTSDGRNHYYTKLMHN